MMIGWNLAVINRGLIHSLNRIILPNWLTMKVIRVGIGIIVGVFTYLYFMPITLEWLAFIVFTFIALLKVLLLMLVKLLILFFFRMTISGILIFI
jgi:hypothetical protein